MACETVKGAVGLSVAIPDENCVANMNSIENKLIPFINREISTAIPFRLEMSVLLFKVVWFQRIKLSKDFMVTLV